MTYVIGEVMVVTIVTYFQIYAPNQSNVVSILAAIEHQLYAYST